MRGIHQERETTPLQSGKPIILFECKHHAADLSKVHASQLYRYFSMTEARFAVLTNGLVYWFYTDLEAANKMDARPFFEFNLLDVRDQDVEELKKFSKSAFDLTNILTTGGIRGSFGVGPLRCFLLMPLFPSAGAAEAGAAPSLRSAHRYTRAHTANR